MLYDHIKNNYAEVSGIVESDFEYSHEIYGERFYQLRIRTSRLSASSDIIPLLLSERLIDITRSYIGKQIRVSGQFRSFNHHYDNKSHLILYLFVREFAFCEDGEEGEFPQMNDIYLDGYLCKPSVYRRTPRGREICDLLLAVNRAYSKSDYIPCICWGRNARYAARIPVGSRVRVRGRIQSRMYQKRLEDDRVIMKEAFEISVARMEFTSEEDEAFLSVADSGSIRSRETKEREDRYEDSAPQRNK